MLTSFFFLGVSIAQYRRAKKTRRWAANHAANHPVMRHAKEVLERRANYYRCTNHPREMAISWDVLSSSWLCQTCDTACKDAHDDVEILGIINILELWKDQK